MSFSPAAFRFRGLLSRAREDPSPQSIRIVDLAAAPQSISVSKQQKLVRDQQLQLKEGRAREETVCLGARDAAAFPLVGSVASPRATRTRLPHDLRVYRDFFPGAPRGVRAGASL